MPAALSRRAEWSFVRFVRGMYAGDTPESWLPQIPLQLEKGLAGKGTARPLFENVAPLIAKGTWKFLARNGGYRKRDVVVNGRARAGRLWEETVWGAAPLSIGPGTLAWLVAFHDALTSEETPRPVSARTTAAMSVADPAALRPGDRLALTAAMSTMYRTQSVFDQIAQTAEPITPVLPAFALAHPRMWPAAQAWKLGEDHETTALQFFDDAMASAWVAEVQRLRTRVTVAEQGTAFERLGNLIGSLFTVAAKPETAHFLIPVARFFPLLWRDLGGVDGLTQLVEKSAGTLPTRGDREQYEFRVGSLLHNGVRLDDRVQQVLQTPWPDRTEAQKRLVAEHETRYRGIRDEVRTLARRLRRELG